MVRWLKLFGDQYFGFWVLGLVLFAIQEIPYMVMPLVKMEANPIMNMVETSAALDACEKGTPSCSRSRRAGRDCSSYWR